MLAEMHHLPNTTTALHLTATRDIPQPKRRVLLVDDNDPLREMLNAVLEHHGFEVEEASNVNDALKLIAAQTFDVLLSDLQMPNAGDGLTVVSAMRHSNPKAATFILSG
jgi:CheY-like chemotaxis protein